MLPKKDNWCLSLFSYDMHGNALEWCEDWYDVDYYKNSPAVDPTGPETSADRVLRGGSWIDDPRSSRSSCRRSVAPDFQSVFSGFRVVLVQPDKTRGHLL